MACLSIAADTRSPGALECFREDFHATVKVYLKERSVWAREQSREAERRKVQSTGKTTVPSACNRTQSALFA
jgi:hypothetical protein